jgi:hypothetical protein
MFARKTNASPVLAFLAVVLIIIALCGVVSFFGSTNAPIKAEAKANNALGQAAPYVRYPRFVQVTEGCAGVDGVVYKGTKVSNGGGTYSEMYFIFANDLGNCKAFRVVVTTPEAVCYEDQPCWDCATMGNLRCGHVAAPSATPESIKVVVESTPEPAITPTETPKPDEKGNPGNLKAVGHAGEDPNGKGTMVLDDPNGVNGEHGNQGQGGQNNGKGR